MRRGGAGAVHASLYRGFLANAVVVPSAVGRLHVKRMFDASGVTARVFDDEREAQNFLAVSRAR